MDGRPGFGQSVVTRLNYESGLTFFSMIHETADIHRQNCQETKFVVTTCHVVGNRCCGSV